MNIKTTGLIVCLLVSGMSLQVASSARISTVSPRHTRSCVALVLSFLALTSRTSASSEVALPGAHQDHQAAYVSTSIPCTKVFISDGDNLYAKELPKPIVELPFPSYSREKNAGFLSGRIYSLLAQHNPYLAAQASFPTVTLQSTSCPVSCVNRGSRIECEIHAYQSARDLNTDIFSAE